MDVHRELADLRASLAAVTEGIAAFEAEVGAVAPGVSGPTPGAAENRTIRAARARLAQQQAREMREGLDRVRSQAATTASGARSTRARIRGGSRRPTTTAGPDDAVVVAPVPDAPEAERGPAHELAAAGTRDEVLARLVSAAVRTVPGARWAGVCSRAHDGSLRVEVVTDPAVAELAALGARDLPGARDLLGARGLLVHWIAGPRVGRPLALVVAADGHDDVPDEGAARVARVLADHALIALTGVARSDGASSVGGGGDVVGCAQGILVARHGLDPREALDRLLRAAEQANTRLADVASWVVDDAVGTEVRRAEHGS